MRTFRNGQLAQVIQRELRTTAPRFSTPCIRKLTTEATSHPEPSQSTPSLADLPPPQPPTSSNSTKGFSSPSTRSPPLPRAVQSKHTYAEFVKNGTLLRAVVKRLPYASEKCSKVQAGVLGHVLEGRDILIQANSCPGRTTSYLVPLFSKHLAWSSPAPAHIELLIISPTEQRAEAVHAKCARLVGESTGIRVRCVHGGSGTEGERGAIVARRTDVLVTTPGRLLDHLVFTPGIAEKLSGLKCIVYDDADQWKDQTVSDWLPAIQKKLPKGEARQIIVVGDKETPSLKQVASMVLPEGYTTVSV